MLNRRAFMIAAASGVATTCLPIDARADTFDADLAAFAAKPEEIEFAAQLRERQLEELQFFSGRPFASRPPASSREISERAKKLIVTFEVTSETRYVKKYQSPIWPQGQSGVTIGIGYDIGYVRSEWLEEDWQDINGITPQMISDLAVACGVTAGDAKRLLPQLKHIVVPWDAAYFQFKNRVLPRYIGETISSLPNAEMLSDDSLGALVSLVYNRGASFKKTTPRYSEMRRIRLHMVSKEFDKIPSEIISMKRLWQGKPNMGGILGRRDLEAELFKAGLK